MRRAAALAAALAAAGCAAQREGAPPPPRVATPAAERAPAALPPERPAWRPAPVVADAPLRPERRVTVAPGEGFLAIARREGVPPAALAEANALEAPYALAPGQVLVVPGGRYHRVRRGETLSQIARAYRTGFGAVARANRMAEPYPLEVGDVVLLPVPRPTTLDERVAANRLDIDRLIRAAPPPRAPAARPPVRVAGGTAAAARRPRAAPATATAPAATVAAAPVRSLAEEALAAGLRFDWPVEGRIVSGFGRKPGGRVNDGVNIAVVAGAPVRASADGQVIYAGTGVAAFGGLVLLRHAGGWITAYGHNEALLVAKGERVARGQALARAGATGEVDGPQLHFEIRRGRAPVDPLKLLPGRAS